jgi:chitodextrinase
MPSLRHAATVLVALLTVLSVTAAPASADRRPKDVGQSLAVPAYFSPAGEGADLWRRLGAPGVGLAVANPFSGPGKDFDPAYAAAISAARDSGVTVLGYVATGYLGSTGRATRLGETDSLAWLAQAQQDIATWYRLYGEYGLGGVFFDEVQNVCGPDNRYADTYRALDDAAGRLHPGAFTVINPGIGTEECYADIADVSLNFEGTYESYLAWQPPAWQRSRDPRRFWHLVHATGSQAQMADAMRLGRERGAGYMYVTPDVLANPWDSLPPDSYWTAELDAARTTADGTAPTRPGQASAVRRAPTSLTLAWLPSIDRGSGVAGYDVYLNGLRVAGSAGRTPTLTVGGLAPSTTYSVEVRARDVAGNPSARARAVRLTTRSADSRPPGAPRDLRAAEVKVAAVRLAWQAPQDSDVTAYDIRLDGRPLMTLPAALLTGGVTVPISGLTPDTAYTFAVTARDASGNTSAEAGPLTVTTSTPSGEPISEGQAMVDAQAVTYRARYNLPFDFHHVFVDIDSDAATGFATAGVGADFLIENGWFYRHTGTGWNWTPVDAPNPLVSSADDLFVWRIPLSVLGDGVAAHRVVFHGAGSSPEAYSPIINVQ